MLVAVLLWGVYFFSIATPGIHDRFGNRKGADFLQFYVLGTLARQHQASLLYDVSAQLALARKLLPQAPGKLYPPLYGPQLSLFFAPYAALPYGWAAAAWALTGILLYGACCYALWRACPHLRGEASSVAILAAGFPVFFRVIACGQNSLVALGAFTATFFALRAERPWLAGAALGVLAFKPQFGIVAALVFILTLQWRVILGAIACAAGQVAMAVWFYGAAVVEIYRQHLAGYPGLLASRDPHLNRMHSLLGFWQMLVPWPKAALVLYALTAIIVLAATFRCWKSPASLGLRFAALLLGTVLIDPHLLEYDLVVLLPALLFLGDWVLGAAESLDRDAAKVFLYAVYALPLLTPLLCYTHVQFSVLAMAALLFVLVRITATQSARLPSRAQTEVRVR